MIKIFCDCCGCQVQADNPGRTGLTIEHSVYYGSHPWEFKNIRIKIAAELFGKDDDGEADLCARCIMAAINKKDRRPVGDSAAHD